MLGFDSVMFFQVRCRELVGLSSERGGE